MIPIYCRSGFPSPPPKHVVTLGRTFPEMTILTPIVMGFTYQTLYQNTCQGLGSTENSYLMYRKVVRVLMCIAVHPGPMESSPAVRIRGRLHHQLGSPGLEVGSGWGRDIGPTV